MLVSTLLSQSSEEGNRLAVCDLFGLVAAVTDTGFSLFRLNDALPASREDEPSPASDLPRVDVAVGALGATVSSVAFAP